MAFAFQESGPKSRTPLFLLLGWVTVVMAWWGLAFYPASQETPAWVNLAREVCFGSAPNGLPATYGWILLFAGPAIFLASIVLSYGEELASLAVELKMSPLLRVGAFAVFAALVWEAAWIGSTIRKIQAGMESVAVAEAGSDLGPLPESYPRSKLTAVPAFRLVDQTGSVFTQDQLKGKVSVVTFVFAHCQTMCPLLLRQTTGALERMDSSETQGVFFTLDPWRDTPASLPKLAERWKLPKTGSFLLSGTPPEVTAALDGFQVPWTRSAKNGDVTHPALVYVIDRAGRIAYLFNNPTADWLVEAVRRVK